MPPVVARTLDHLSQSTDFKADIHKLIGQTLDETEVYLNHILVATYIRPERTKGGILRPDSNKEEDIYQGKVGMVLKMGPGAFVDDEEREFLGQKVNVGDFIVYKAGDGWSITIDHVACRMLTDFSIKLRIKSPEKYF